MLFYYFTWRKLFAGEVHKVQTSHAAILVSSFHKSSARWFTVDYIMCNTITCFFMIIALCDLEHKLI